MRGSAYFLSLFHYNKWANSVLISAVCNLDDSDQDGKILSLAGHLYAAEVLWFARLNGIGSDLAVWPTLSIMEIAEGMDQQAKKWTDYLEHLDNTNLTKPISYVNSNGVPWASRVDEILMHVITHASYHRGQIAMLLAKAGAVPPNTDLIHGVREGYVEGWQ